MGINIAGKDIVCPECHQWDSFQITFMDSRGGEVTCLICGTDFYFTPN
ncbi:unnamed protein product [[Actinomadura] parvosata subsp. kistnae]|uniref:Uncharacterized protein n=1 Tax=Nonomuraea composti TaxID=2720023 RepID=A0ABX1AWR0_9ACTN|nr:MULTISPECIES: hypothetical protein [unclassified Nonomuraea]NJP90055.1 hypothetical protein [Nonomuraea sp. FMUSA5-5]SPL96901.1 unnamed protein product [Actinomadura parvosata subsp. kistnae]